MAETVRGRIHSWDLYTGVDGPGTRFVLLTSGCPLHCLYCANPDTWHMRDGKETIVDEVMEEIGKYRDFITTTDGRVTVTGGEPLLQSAFTGEVLRRCKEAGLHTAVDTSGSSAPARATNSSPTPTWSCWTSSPSMSRPTGTLRAANSPPLSTSPPALTA